MAGSKWGVVLGIGVALALSAGYAAVEASLDPQWPSPDSLHQVIARAAPGCLYIAIAGSALIGLFGWILGRGQDELLDRSLTDVLTGLPNRRHLNDRLAAELARASRKWADLAVLFVDLDELKRINDTVGHHAGDAALRGVAAALRRACRSMD